MIKLTDSTFGDFIINNHSVPILAMFTSSRCGPCKAMRPLIESINDPNILIVKIDTDLNPGLISHFNVRSVPTLMIIHENNIIRRTGFLSSRQEIINFIQG